jgi:hypothetical protein
MIHLFSTETKNQVKILFAMSQSGLQLPIAQSNIIHGTNGVKMEWLNSTGLGHIAFNSRFMALISSFTYFQQKPSENSATFRQSGLQLPIAQSNIIHGTNGVKMEWLNSTGMGHIAFRSWFFALILPCFTNFSTKTNRKFSLPWARVASTCP